MRRINITIESSDDTDIEKIMQRYGLSSRSAAIRFAVRAEISRIEFVERGGTVTMTNDSQNSPPASKTPKKKR